MVFFYLNSFPDIFYLVCASISDSLFNIIQQRSGCLGSTLAVMKKSSKFLPVYFIMTCTFETKRWNNSFYSVAMEPMA